MLVKHDEHGDTTKLSALAIFAYVSGHAQFANYLLIPHLPGAGELIVFCCALVGAGLGFLWFNTYPAQVFMGDVRALALGAALGHRSASGVRASSKADIAISYSTEADIHIAIIPKYIG